jgi:NAD+ kinase
MRLGVVAGSEASMIEDAKEVVSILNESGVETIVEESLAGSFNTRGEKLEEIEGDLLVVIGSDRTLLNTLLKLGHKEIPVLPVSSKGQPDFLFDVPAANFESTVTDLLEGRWSEDHRARLVADVAGVESPPLLNDLALFAKRSATLIRYSLYLDGEQFWKDGSDGLIIATPTGSTAYSMSVGGPVVLNQSGVTTIIPVNSVNPARRPLVVSDTMTITIKDLSSPVTVEAVLDGQERRTTNGEPLVIRRAKTDAVFVKFSQETVAALRGKLLKKTEVYDGQAQDLPPSAKLVLKVLEYQGMLTQKEIIEETMLPSRTVRYALSILLADGFVKKRTSLRDGRQGLYQVANAEK